MPRKAKVTPQQLSTEKLDKDGLNPRQRAFIDHYIGNGFNATQAAISAGYSIDTARQQASRLLTNVYIASEITRIYQQNTMSAEEILARLSEMGRGDLGDVWDENAGMVNWKQTRALGKSGLIKRIKHKTIRTTTDDGKEVETFEDEIELHDPMRAMETIAKIHGIMINRLQISVEDQIIQMIRDRQISYAAALDVYKDESLVREFFLKAGVPVQVGSE